MAKTQFVWIYWDGGKQGDELRWSMRSVLKHFQGEPEIILVGDKPDWYSGEHIHVPRYGEVHHRNFRDCMNKIHVACNSSAIQDEFIYMMDDVYFVSDVSLEQLSRHWFLRGQVLNPQKTHPGNSFKVFRCRSFKRLIREGYTSYDYGTHSHQHVSKEQLLETWDRFRLDVNTLSWQLLLGNVYWTPWRDCTGLVHRVTEDATTEEIEEDAREAIVLNNSNNGWSETLRAYLWNTFRDRAEHETRDAEEPDWDEVKVSRREFGEA